MKDPRLLSAGRIGLCHSLPAQKRVAFQSLLQRLVGSSGYASVKVLASAMCNVSL